MILLYAKILKFFEETPQTNWGKLQIKKELERIYLEIASEIEERKTFKAYQGKLLIAMESCAITQELKYKILDKLGEIL